MFASVLERNLPPRQIARGAALALGVHAVVIVGAVLLSTRSAPAVVVKDIPTLKQLVQTRFVDLGNKGGTGGGPVRRAAADHRAARAAVVDADRSKKRVSETAGSVTPAESHAATGDATGTAEGPVTPSAGGGDGIPGGTAAGGTTIAIPFGEGMQRPSLLAHPAPVYTREASASHASGNVIAKCVITLEGSLRHCRIVKGIPHMDAAVLEALSQWRYTPVMFQGRAVSVDYTINLRLVAP